MTRREWPIGNLGMSSAVQLHYDSIRWLLSPLTALLEVSFSLVALSLIQQHVTSRGCSLRDNASCVGSNTSAASKSE